MVFLHVLFVQSDIGWYAQCLDFDLGAQGATLEDAERAFAATLRLQAQVDRENGRVPFAHLGPPPPDYLAIAEAKSTKWEHRTLADADDSNDGVVPPAFMLAAQTRRHDSVPPSRG